MSYDTELEINRHYANPSDYKQGGINNSRAFKQSIFTLHLIFGKTARILEFFAANPNNKLKERVEPHYAKLVRIIADLLDMDMLSAISKFYPGLPTRIDVDDEVYGSWWYWADLRKFGDIVGKEFERVGSPSFTTPKQIQHVLGQIDKIAGGKFDKTIIEKYYPPEDVLTLHKDGVVDFYSYSTDKIHTAKFKIGSNLHRLIKYLAENPNKIWGYDDLGKRMKGRNRDDRTIRDAVRDIRKRLDLKSKELFIIKSGVGISCKVIIK